MRVFREQDPALFLQKVGPLLREKPAENNLMLGLLGELSAGWSPDVRPVLLTAEGRQGVEGVAVQTPPRALILSRSRADAVESIFEFVTSSDMSIPGVVGPRETVEHFAALWATRTGRIPVLRVPQVVYELTQVSDLPETPGSLRRAVDTDEVELAEWAEAFIGEVGMDPLGDARAFVREKIGNGQFFIWQDGASVTMAAWLGRTAQGARVGYVYTPPRYRRRGYGSGCVAALSRRLLGEGCPACFLFTDRRNASTNRMYRRIGYRAVCEFALYDFPGG